MKIYLLTVVVVVAQFMCRDVGGSSSLTKCKLKSILDAIYSDNSEDEDLAIKCKFHRVYQRKLWHILVNSLFL